MIICLQRAANDLHMAQLMPLPADHLLLHYNPDQFSLSGASLPRLSWKRGCETDVCLTVKETNVFAKILCPPLPSNRHHWSNDDCLEGKWENYQVYSVQYCAQQLCTVHTHMNTPNRSLDWVLSHWARFTVLRSIFMYVCMCFLYDCILHACVVL